jgi:flagellar protein FlbD
MIWVTRLNGTEMVVNADLIETVESTPDTVLTLVDGKKYVVHESPRQVVDEIRAYRASILSVLDAPEAAAVPTRSHPSLYVLPGADGEES